MSGQTDYSKQVRHRMSVRIYQTGGSPMIFEAAGAGAGSGVTGNLLSVATTAGIGQVAGTWQIELSVSEKGGAITTWYDRIHYMDYVEILLASSPRTYAESRTAPPIVMRGFVDTVNAAYSGSGQWAVTVAGRDYGKLLLERKLFLGYEINMFEAGDPNWLSLENLHLSPIQDVASSIQQIVQVLIADPITGNLGFYQGFNSAAPNLGLSIDSQLSNYQTWTLSINQMSGAAWNVIDDFLLSPPFGEGFIREATNGPELVARVVPYKTVGDPSSMAGTIATDPGYITSDITLEEVIAWYRNRSGLERYDFIFTYPNLSNISDQMVKAINFQDGVNPWYDLVSIRKYGGPNRLDAQTNWIGVAPGQSADAVSQDTISAMDLATQLNVFLTNALKNYQDLESGSITIPLDERLQVGKYVRLLGMEYYVQGVAHNADVNTATTTLQLVRGQKVAG